MDGTKKSGEIEFTQNDFPKQTIEGEFWHLFPETQDMTVNQAVHKIRFLLTQNLISSAEAYERIQYLQPLVRNEMTKSQEEKDKKRFDELWLSWMFLDFLIVGMEAGQKMRPKVEKNSGQASR